MLQKSNTEIHLQVVTFILRKQLLFFFLSICMEKGLKLHEADQS